MFIGAVSAMLLTLILSGNFVSGNLFPTGYGDFFSLTYSSESWSKLLFWAFLAGFSERMISGFLDTMERQFATQPVGQPDGPKSDPPSISPK